MKNIPIAIAMLVAGGALAAGNLFDAIRADDRVAIQRLLTGSEDLNTRNERDATPLMVAAGFGSEAALKLLLDKGADVNSASKTGATSLMWAIRHPAKVRLLLDLGANVNARREDGNTPLLLALAAPGNTEVVRQLVAKGADLGAVNQAKRGALALAYRTRDAETIALLERAGLKLEKASGLGSEPLSILGSGAPVELVRALLDKGADPNEFGRTVTLTYPMLAIYANAGRLDLVRLLLARGANPNAKGNQGYNALMMAAGANRRHPEMIHALLKAGADVTLRDARGRSALDWALTQGETEVAAILREAGGETAAPPVPAKAVTEPRSAADALAKVIPHIAQAGPTSSRKVACVNCHNNSLPSMALRLSRERGLAVSGEMVQHYPATYVKTTSRSWENSLWNTGGATYTEWGLIDQDFPRSLQTDARVQAILRGQRPDGSWGGNDSTRPPLGKTVIKSTAIAIRTLTAWATDARGAVSHARAFLEQAEPQDTQDAVFQLLGLKWAGAGTEPSRHHLASLQREDGGWGQMPTMPSDAYATGQALYALHTGGGLPVTGPAYVRGIRFLLGTQLEDGTWFVRTRAFGFQPYYEGGFPHGVDQFMSASASSWAAMALAYSLEAPPNPIEKTN